MIDVRIKDSFWKRYQDLVHDKVLPYQWDVLNDTIPGIEPSRAIRNFRIAAGLEKGEHYGFVFQDSDLAKWLETVGHCLRIRPDPELEKRADEAIDLLEKAQGPDGYLNTYFTVKDPTGRWANLREAHELYCAGHFIEAAVAYDEATGKSRFLDVMVRYADLIDRTFGPEPGKTRGYCGHPEIELALVKLFRATGNRRYLDLGRYFIDERGREPYYFDLEDRKRGSEHAIWGGSPDRRYFQAHAPVRMQTTAEGHAVRLAYLFSAAADVALLTEDAGLRAACENVWNNITARRMYVTGGIGSTPQSEAFTCDYDLPNDSAYTETCASVAMVFFAHRMLALNPESSYADVMELELYNTVLAGISLDGTRYFYVNPLEVRPEACAANQTLRHVKPVRQSWYACACCPPNVARLIASLGRYVYSIRDDRVYAHLYIGSAAELDIGGARVRITQDTRFPHDGKVSLGVGTAEPCSFALCLRIPGWTSGFRCSVNGKEIRRPGGLEKGYLVIDRRWSDGDRVELELPMPVRLLRANPKVPHAAGKAAIQRGPFVYCLEETDNGPDLHDLRIGEAGLSAEYEPDLLGGTVVVKGNAVRSDEKQWPQSVLYAPLTAKTKAATLLAVPYYLWCNREPGEMTVWINLKGGLSG